MIPETVFGLPAHILIVHGVVVLVPLAALGLVAVAAVPRWRERYGVLVAALAVVAAGNTFAAAMSGSVFQDNLVEQGVGGPVLEKIQEHAALGDQLRWYVLALAIAAVALVVLARRGVARNVLAVVVLVSLVASGASIVQVVRTGHAGSTAVWNPLG